jgi:hypothetical protein
MALALRLGYWPDEDGPPAGPGPAATGSAYSDLLVDTTEPPFGEGDTDG